MKCHCFFFFTDHISKETEVSVVTTFILENTCDFKNSTLMCSSKSFLRHSHLRDNP